MMLLSDSSTYVQLLMRPTEPDMTAVSKSCFLSGLNQHFYLIKKHRVLLVLNITAYQSIFTFKVVGSFMVTQI